MMKQSCTLNFCSPLHCSIINSNLELLNFFLKHVADMNVSDSMGRKPIHYAAVLDNPKTM